MSFMMSSSCASTSSRVHDIRSEFCDISSPLVPTPPAVVFTCVSRRSAEVLRMKDASMMTDAARDTEQKITKIKDAPRRKHSQAAD